MTSFRCANHGATLVALAACLAAPALADDTADATIIVIAEHLADAHAAVKRTPGGVDIVNADAFADRLAVNLRDTLAFSPGVYTQPRFGEEVRLSIRGSGISRGFHMRGLTLLQDGVPINLADNNGDFQELDPLVFQHLEVYRGANAMRYGSTSLGGAVNAVTPTGRSAPMLDLRLEGGSFDTLRAKMAGAFATDHGDAFAALTYARSDGDREHSKRDALRFNGNIGVILADAIETRFYAAAQLIDQDLPSAITRAQALTTPRVVQAINRFNDYERDIDSIRFQNRTTVALGDNRLEVGAFLNAKQLFHPIFQVIDQTSTDWGGYARFDGRGSIGGMPVEATVGGTARFGHTVAKQWVNAGGERGPLTANGNQSASTLDAYGELRAFPVDELALIAGGQFVHGRRRLANRLNAQVSAVKSYDTFSPKLGALWTPRRNVQVYANVSRSVELPGFGELVQQPVVGFVPLDPQRGWTAEVGTRGRSGAVAWDVALYHAWLKGEMLQFTIDPNVPASTFNADRTIHQGIEAGLDLTLTPWVTLRQIYQFNDFHFRSDAQYDDNRLPVVPKHLYRAELRLDIGRFTVAPNLEWVPQGAWADYRNTTRAPGYVLIGATASAEVRDGFELFVDARNVAANNAIGDISAVIQAAPTSTIYYPVERRALYGGVRARF